MKLSVVIFGAGRFGTALAEELFKSDTEVMIVDKDYELIKDLSDHVTAAVQCDITDEQSVKELGLGNFDIAIIAIGGNLESSIIATMFAKEYEIPRVIAKASSSLQADILKKLGADQIVFPEVDVGVRLARNICGKNILEYIHLSDDYSILEIKVIDKWVGKNLIEIDFRNIYNLNVVALKRKSHVIITDLPTTDLQRDDLLVVIGQLEAVQNLQKLN